MKKNNEQQTHVFNDTVGEVLAARIRSGYDAFQPVEASAAYLAEISSLVSEVLGSDVIPFSVRDLKTDEFWFSRFSEQLNSVLPSDTFAADGDSKINTRSKKPAHIRMVFRLILELETLTTQTGPVSRSRLFVSVKALIVMMLHADYTPRFSSAMLIKLQDTLMIVLELLATLQVFPNLMSTLTDGVDVILSLVARELELRADAKLKKIK
jgi:hypothetical protein